LSRYFACGPHFTPSFESGFFLLNHLLMDFWHYHLRALSLAAEVHG
jgi:hypothetical protein